MLIGEIDDLFRYVAFIEGIAPLISKESQGSSQIRILKNFAVSWRPPIIEIGLRGVRCLPQEVLLPSPLARDDFGNRKAIGCVIDRRFKQSRHRQLAVLFMQLEPPG